MQCLNIAPLFLIIDEVLSTSQAVFFVDKFVYYTSDMFEIAPIRRRPTYFLSIDSHYYFIITTNDKNTETFSSLYYSLSQIFVYKKIEFIGSLNWTKLVLIVIIFMQNLTINNNRISGITTHSFM